MGPNETSKLLHSKGNYKQDKKTTLRMGNIFVTFSKTHYNKTGKNQRSGEKPKSSQGKKDCNLQRNPL